MSLYRLLSALLSYPEQELLDALPEIDAALAEHPWAGETLEPLTAWLGGQALIPLQETYVATFDRNRSHSLHLFEHVHGDSRERGPALIDLMQTYEKAGLQFDAQELPDHLAVVLEFASTQPPAVAREFLGEMAHILNALFTALTSKGNPYACVIAAVLEVAGQRVQAVAIAPEPGLDDAWAEPEAFDGCATRGQNRPDQPQPLHFVRNARANSSQGASV